MPRASILLEFVCPVQAKTISKMGHLKCVNQPTKSYHWLSYWLKRYECSIGFVIDIVAYSKCVRLYENKIGSRLTFFSLFPLQGHRCSHFNDKCEIGWHNRQHCHCTITRFILSSANIYSRCFAGWWRFIELDVTKYNANSTFVTMIQHQNTPNSNLTNNPTNKPQPISKRPTKRSEFMFMRRYYFTFYMIKF